jgi:periplasmic protein TonB
MIPASSGSENGSGFLGQCLVESDRSHEKRDRRNKQRALIISIVVQILIVAALILFPLFSKGENIAGRVATPIPPYARAGNSRHSTDPRPHPPGDTATCHFCDPPTIPPNIVTYDPIRPVDNGESEGPLIPGAPTGDPNAVIGGPIRPQETRVQPPQNGPHDTSEKKRQRVSEQVQQAMLIHRVEPAYPKLAIQIHREGRVQLHAIISTDGSIQSLEVISGDPLLIRSSLDAVSQWRYRPTILNGQPIEVETYITVIYTISR